MRTIRLRDVLEPDAVCHVARTHFPRRRGAEGHRHDFAELFWIAHGSGLHLINGHEQPLRTGDLVFIQPDDVHGFRCCGQQPMDLTNVAFPSDTLARLAEPYFPREQPPWQRRCDPPAVPRSFALSSAQRQQLETLAEPLGRQPQSALGLHRLLLSVLDEVTRGARSLPRGAALPPWLADAFRQLARDDDLRLEGGAALPSLTGRSREHFSRLVKRNTGQTLSQLVNEIRLDHAAADLRLSQNTVLAVAVDAGLPNLGHFYHLFRQRFGLTPDQYRRQARAVAGGGA